MFGRSCLGCGGVLRWRSGRLTPGPGRRRYNLTPDRLILDGRWADVTITGWKR
jgi:hypothetical protein